MDSPSDLFCQQPSPMCPFGLYRSPPGAAPMGPRYPGSSPQPYSFISPLLHPSSASQRWGNFRQRQGIFQGSSFGHEHVGGMMEGEEDDEEEVPEREELLGRRAGAAAETPLSSLSTTGTRRGGNTELEIWNQDIVKRLRMKNTAGIAGEAEEEVEERGRTPPKESKEDCKRGGQGWRKRCREGQRDESREGRKRQRQELKIQLQETREKLLELQKKVWRVYSKQQAQTEEKRDSRKEGRHNGEAATAEVLDILTTEEEEMGSDFQNINGKSSDGNAGNDFPEDTLGLDIDLDLDLGRSSMWVGCGLVRGGWEGPSGSQKFAQALKRELGSAMARVIDRVLRLYVESESPPFPPPVVTLIPAKQNGGLNPDSSMEQNKQRIRPMPRSLEWTETSPLTSKRQVEKRNPNSSTSSSLSSNIQPGPNLSQSSPTLPPLPQSALPALLPPRAKEPAVPSFPSGPPPVPLPLLHYTMQHLFARSISSFPLHKDCLSSEAFLDFRSHAPTFTPLPILGQLDSSFPSSDRGRDGGMRGGGMGLMDGGESSLYLNTASSQEGLSPCHLKKAKLMFFYTRYPSSNTLKTYFPDVKFNRCVTSQLIKWFSNFREFFYIQMERFARQAARDGVTTAREGSLRLCRDSELYRILNMHYNKSNDYQVPDRFVAVSELALREFFTAIQSGRDTDPCWKKSIYKIICKLDSPIPDIFRLPGCPMDTHRSARDM
ncbi:prospero homeobox 3 [Denticeps clupeoides]|uniref:Prospero domain-containing protein n=1 Tax=Denticeps clupeoides TaxID=299321 RepID=A0AAY4BU62_9TELE|nr:prospero homeobox protein 1-like [Denticeps clupeoides]